jgi:hypothetical protein
VLAYDEERRPPAAGGAALGGQAAVVDGRVRHAVGAGEQGVRAGRHRRRRSGAGALCGRRSAKSNGRRSWVWDSSGARSRETASRRRELPLDLDDGWIDSIAASAAAAGGNPKWQ